MLANTLHLMLSVCLASVEDDLHAESQIAALKCVHCLNFHVDTTPTTITSKYVCKCSVCNKTWYEN